MRGVVMIGALLATLVSPAVTQEQGGRRGGFDLTAHALWSHQDAGGSSTDDALGVEAGLGYRLPNGLALEIRSSYRSWEGERYVPLHLGLRYDLALHPLVTVQPFAGAGPSLVWGGDWGSVFASFDVGARVAISLGRDSRVRASLGGSYGRGMTFHPSEFGVLNLVAGLSLDL